MKHASVGIVALAFVLSGTAGAASPDGPAGPIEDCRSLTVDSPPYAGHPRVVTMEVEATNPPKVPVSVLLPPGYDAPGNDRRYPVLYLLHGLTMNRDSWLVFTDVEELSSDPRPERHAIVVMPSGSGLVVDIDHRNGTWMWETFYTARLIPYIDANFRTVADRSGRAIAGLSGGGSTAMHLTARHPDLFAAVGGFAGGYDFGDIGIGGTLAIGADRVLWACSGGRVGDEGVFGDPIHDNVWYRNLSPVDLAGNFHGVSVYVANGDGTPCDEQDVNDILFPPTNPVHGPAYVVLESLLVEGSHRFDRALTRSGVSHTADLDGCGLHSWRYWERDLHVFWEIMFEAFDAPGPMRFDYRTADAPNNRTASNGRQLLIANSVWGWTFSPDPVRATEFLDVTDASAEGVTLTGSGLTSVMTPPIFDPDQVITLTGAVEPSAVADAAGQIGFRVDLGAPHEFQQYTPAALALEAAGGYWASRRVVFGHQGG